MGQAAKAIPLLGLAVAAVYVGTRGSGRVLAAGKALASPGPAVNTSNPAALPNTSGAAGTSPDPSKNWQTSGGGGDGPPPLKFWQKWFAPHRPDPVGTTIGNAPNALNQDTGLAPYGSSGPNSFNPGYRPDGGGAGTWGQLMPTYQHAASFTGAAMYSSEGN